MSVIRLLYFLREYDYPDFTYDNTTLAYWTCIEVDTAIVCACVTTLKPLINRHLPWVVRSRITAPSNAIADDHHTGLDFTRPLTFGSRPLRRGTDTADNNRGRSWLVLPDGNYSDANEYAPIGGREEDEEEEELELVAVRGKNDAERTSGAALEQKLDLPARPENVLVRRPRAAPVDGSEARPIAP